MKTRAGRLANDVVHGIRLSVGGSRNSRTAWFRLGAGAVSVALVVAVLLSAASLGSILDAREARRAATSADMSPRPGVAPVYISDATTSYRDHVVRGRWMYATGPTAPVPPGLDRVPGPGEVAVSPALAELLASPEGSLLRPRFAHLRQIGLIQPDAVVDVDDLIFYAGADAGLAESAVPGEHRRAVYGFGSPGQSSPKQSSSELSAILVTVGSLGIAAVLIPLLVYVAASARVGGAERDRRTAALRLVGADLWQTRRIVAAEATVPALAGVALGALVFVAARPLLADVRIGGAGAHLGDIVPAWPWVVLIALGVPVLAVVTVLFAQRAVVVAPLGALRQSGPRRRRLWWRPLPLVVGVFVLLYAGSLRESERQLPAASGTALVLLGVAFLLPWLVETVVRRMRGGPVAWQLAVRRLQLDAGSAVRVVSGLVVVLAGAVALHVALSSTEVQQRAIYSPTSEVADPALQIAVTKDHVERARELVATVPGVLRVHVEDAFESNPEYTAEHFGVVWVEVDLDRPVTAEHVLNAVAPLGWRARSDPTAWSYDRGYATTRSAVLAGAILILTIAAVHLLGQTVERIRERRRPLAGLTAAGVRFRTLALSVLWQSAIPLLVGIVLAVVGGLALAALALRMQIGVFAVDWPEIGALCAAAVLAVPAVTALALPTLRAAVSVQHLRTE